MKDSLRIESPFKRAKADALSSKVHQLENIHKEHLEEIRKLKQSLGAQIASNRPKLPEVPPQQISEWLGATPEDGVVMRHLFVGDTQVLRGGVYLEHVQGKPKLEVTVWVGSSQKILEFPLKEGFSSFNIGEQAPHGSRLVARLNVPATGIWIGFNYK